MEPINWYVDPEKAWADLHAELRRRFEPLGFRVERHARDPRRDASFSFSLEIAVADKRVERFGVVVAVDATLLRLPDAKNYLLYQREHLSQQVLKKVWEALPK